MKTLSLLALAGVLAIPAVAAENPAKAATPAQILPVSEAKITSPFILKDGAISQPATTEVKDGGRAVFTFKVAAAGEYVVRGMVNAPDEDSNSFYLNIDAEPTDPLMIWDLEVTNGFEERVSNWRGNGDSANGEFVPKTFKLTAGEHKLIIGGREPASLKSVSIQPAK
jgi:hypothetical protein